MNATVAAKQFGRIVFILNNPIYLLPIIYFISALIGLFFASTARLFVEDVDSYVPAYVGIGCFFLTTYLSTIYILIKKAHPAREPGCSTLGLDLVVDNDARKDNSDLIRTLSKRIDYQGRFIADLSMHHRASFYCAMFFLFIGLAFLAVLMAGIAEGKKDASTLLSSVLTLLSASSSAIFLKFYSSTSSRLKAGRLFLDQLYGRIFSMQFYMEEISKLEGDGVSARVRESAVTAAVGEIFGARQFEGADEAKS